MSIKELRLEAKAAGLRNYLFMSEEELRKALERAKEEKAEPPKEVKSEPIKVETKPSPAPKKEKKASVSKRVITPETPFREGSRSQTAFKALQEGITFDDLVQLIIERHGGTIQAARSTLRTLISDLQQPIGRYNSARSLLIENADNLNEKDAILKIIGPNPELYKGE